MLKKRHVIYCFAIFQRKSSNLQGCISVWEVPDLLLFGKKYRFLRAGRIFLISLIRIISQEILPQIIFPTLVVVVVGWVWRIVSYFQTPRQVGLRRPLLFGPVPPGGSCRSRRGGFHFRDTVGRSTVWRSQLLQCLHRFGDTSWQTCIPISDPSCSSPTRLRAHTAPRVC